MTNFIKNRSLRRGVLVLVVIVVALALIFRPEENSYKLSSADALRLISQPNSQISVADASSKQLVDLRTPGEYAQSPLRNAIQIPVRELLSKESIAFFDKMLSNNTPVVLCGSTELEVTAPWLLLQQMGYTNCYRLKGKIGENGELKAGDPAETETALLDTAQFNTKGNQPAEIAKPIAKPKKAVVVKPVVQPPSSGGGC